MKTITSRQHPIVGAFRELAGAPDPAGRRLLLDGPHLVCDALDAGLEFELAAVVHSKLDADGEVRSAAEALRRGHVEVVSVDDAVFAALSPVRAPAGIVAVARRDATDLQQICHRPQALIVDNGILSCGILTVTLGTVMIGWFGSMRMPGIVTVAPTMFTPGGCR